MASESTPSNCFLGLSEVGESSKKSRTAHDSENDRDPEMKDETNTARADAHDSENYRHREMKTLGFDDQPKRGQPPKEVNRDSKNTQGSNAWLIQKLMYDCEVGWAEVIVLYLHQTVKVVDRKTGRAYVWNANTALWQDTLSDGVLPEVSRILSGHFDSMSERLQVHIATLEAALKMLIGSHDPKDRQGKTSEEEKEKNLELNILRDRLSEIRKLRLDAHKYSHLNAAYKLAREKLYSKDFGDKLNKIPHLWPLTGCEVLDLRNGSVLPRTKEHMFSIEGPRKYQPKPQYPEVSRFFNEVMCGDPEMIEHMRLKSGYFLTAEVSLRGFDIFTGNGANGKSTWAELMQLVMGEFFALLPKGLILQSKSDSAAGSASPEFLTIRHARLGVFDEIEDDEKLNSRNVKRIANGDAFTCRGLYDGDYQTVHPVVKVVIPANKPPSYDSTDKAMTDRIRWTPWMANFEKQENLDLNTLDEEDRKQKFHKDTAFIDRLKRYHLDDLFSYMVDAAKDFYNLNKTILIPRSVQEKTDTVNTSLNSVVSFLQNVCVLDQKFKTRPLDLYSVYTQYVKQQDLQASKVSRQQFPVALESAGLVKERDHKLKVDFWRGVGLQSLEQDR